MAICKNCIGHGTVTCPKCKQKFTNRVTFDDCQICCSLFVTGKLYVRLIWFHTLKPDLDVDNIAKPIEVFQAIERTRLTEVRNKHLREQAHQEGFTRFWVGITNPPFESQAEIEGVDQQLFEHLVANMPDHLAELPAEVQIERVTQVGFDTVAVTDSASSISLKPEGYRVAGDGLLMREVV